MFDRFEQVNESIITGADVLDCLICLRVTTMFMSGINKDYTERSLAKPANIAFAGGKGWRVNHQRCTSIDPFRRTKPIASPRAVLAQRVYSTETTIERFHDFAITASEFGECSCLLLKHCGNRLDRVAILDFFGERMIGKCRACLLVVVLQGKLEEDSRTRVLWLVAHATVGKW